MPSLLSLINQLFSSTHNSAHVSARNVRRVRHKQIIKLEKVKMQNLKSMIQQEKALNDQLKAIQKQQLELTKAKIRHSQNTGEIMHQQRLKEREALFQQYAGAQQ